MHEFFRAGEDGMILTDVNYEKSIIDIHYYPIEILNETGHIVHDKLRVKYILYVSRSKLALELGSKCGARFEHLILDKKD